MLKYPKVLVKPVYIHTTLWEKGRSLAYSVISTAYAPVLVTPSTVMLPPSAVNWKGAYTRWCSPVGISSRSRQP